MLIPILADDPITTSEEDIYGVAGFARAIAQSLLHHRRATGTVVALNGPWGSGKTSIVNLIREEIVKAQAMNTRVQEEKIDLTDFKCWWFRGEDALILAFLQHLNGILKDGLGDKAKDLTVRISKALLQTTKGVSSALAAATRLPIFAAGGAADLVEKWLFPEETLDSAYTELTEILEKTDRRFIVIIDDIDRLSPEEALAIFRLVKSVGNLPRVTYLLVFDRPLAEAAVQLKYPSEGPHFLEKIIQASFDVPSPNQTDINAALQRQIESVIGRSAAEERRYFGNIFVDIVIPYIRSPRDVARLTAAISVTWPAIGGNVNPAGFVALEVLRLYEPNLFRAIREHRHLVTELRGHRESVDKNRFIPFLNGIADDRQERAKIALQRLFPRLEEKGYVGGFLASWDRARRVCVPKHLETYLRSTLSEETLAKEEIDEFVAEAGDASYVRRSLRGAAGRRRRNGSSFLPVYLDELTAHAERIAIEDIAPFVKALFEVHDEINLLRDNRNSFGAMEDTSLRYHWLIGKLMGRFSVNDRTTILVDAMSVAPLNWAVNFATSAMDEYDVDRRADPIPEENCMVRREALPQLSTVALERLRASAADGSLIKDRHLTHHLYAWKRLSENGAAEVRTWTDSQIGQDESVLTLMRAMTTVGEAAGFSFSGLSDRVATSFIEVTVRDDMDIIDTQMLHMHLQRIADDNTRGGEIRSEVMSFLDAWDKKRKNEDR